MGPRSAICLHGPQKCHLWAPEILLRHKAALITSGCDPRQDAALAIMKEELQEVQEQVKHLQSEMKTIMMETSPAAGGRKGLGWSGSSGS